MQLPSFFQRKAPPAPAAERARAGREAALPSGDEPAPVLAARVRARRRLIGAVVLLGVGIVVFPLLFETAPRPISVDIPIEVPRKAAVPVPAATPRGGDLAEAAGAGDAAKVTLPADAGSEVAATAAASAVAASASTPPLPLRAPPATAAPRASAAVPAKANDGLRAKALLEGASPAGSAAAAGAAGAAAAAGPASAAGDARPSRFVVQVGAFTDANALRETRQKVEKLGLKTYTQVIDSDAGKRTRVRVGPFASRDEAEAAGRTLKAAGLPANILAW